MNTAILVVHTESSQHTIYISNAFLLPFDIDFQHVFVVSRARSNPVRACVKASGLATEDANAITFGIGLHKRSSIRVADPLRRKGTVNLKGKSGAEVKRRSSSYGNPLVLTKLSFTLLFLLLSLIHSTSRV